MEYSNELKVGVAIVLAAIAAFVGIRFFQNVPLFGNSYSLYAEFEEADGLVSGNPVRLKGVQVGSVEEIELTPETHKVRVRLQIRRGPHIPEGSSAQVSGISALGGVHVKIVPGPQENPQLSEEATLQSPSEPSSLQQLTDRAPSLANKADSVLNSTNVTMAQLSRQFEDPNSDLRRTLTSLQRMSGTLENVTEAEKDNIRRLIQNLEAMSRDLKTFTDENSDSLGVAVSRVNRSLNRLNRSLASFEKTSATLDTLTTKLNDGEGTAGRLVNDPGLYMKLDTAAARTNRILLDFENNPSRYLEDMTLVKVF